MLKRTFVIALIVSLVGELPDSEISVGEPSSEEDGPSTEPGEVDAGMDNASIPIPNGFPESFPLPEGTLVNADFSMSQEEGDYHVFFELTGSFEETVAFFEAAFPDAGWEEIASKGACSSCAVLALMAWVWRSVSSHLGKLRMTKGYGLKDGHNITGGLTFMVRPVPRSGLQARNVHARALSRSLASLVALRSTDIGELPRGSILVSSRSTRAVPLQTAKGLSLD
jgi:hypothetical protein